MSYFALLREYNFSIKYWRGAKKDMADALSRRYHEVLNNVDLGVQGGTANVRQVLLGCYAFFYSCCLFFFRCVI
jgi:hypothetical protein